ncbi:MAG: HDOD domain-containing protein [Candidatus Gastranaerophilales bacterium]|nr:HDOD domain-containing protein [Candidatus Gastranaerophilales bacterium]
MMNNNNPNKLDPQQIVAEFKEIPPMPNVMVKALSVIKNPSTGIAELAKIMQVDQAISTKTLSLVNSAFYGFRQQITSINKALVVLGMMKAKNIIMSLALKQMMTAQGSRELWEHSIKCAVAAEILAKEYKVINPDDAFVIGFLHDIGKMLLNSKNPLKYSKVRYLAQQGNVNLIEVEDAQFGTNHCVLGALISKKWQLPVILTNCIRYHHDPLQSSLPTVCGIVYCADRMIQSTMPNPLLDPKIMSKMEFTINDPVALRETILTKAQIFLKEMSSPN